MYLEKIKNLVFNPIGYGCLNATIDIKPGVRVSISKGRLIGCYIGDINDYECAIQVNDSSVSPYWDLTELPNGDTVKSHCNEHEIHYLCTLAEKVNLLKNVWIWDIAEGQKEEQ